MDFLPIGFWYVCAALFGAVIGSFLNVVIHRLPVMILAEPKPSEPYNLITPVSSCPNCEAPVMPWHNIPLFSYFWLKGHCANCDAVISWRYPLVEFCAAMAGALCLWRYGAGLQGTAAFALLMFLLAIWFIDLKHMIIPDALTLPLAGLGVLVSLTGVFCSFEESVIGLAGGYISLFTIYWAIRFGYGKEAMGYGDFKLFSAIGAWLGWDLLFLVLLIGCLGGSLLGGWLMLTRRWRYGIEVPFGPFLILGAVAALFYGRDILDLYWQMFL